MLERKRIVFVVVILFTESSTQRQTYMCALLSLHATLISRIYLQGKRLPILKESSKSKAKYNY